MPILAISFPLFYPIFRLIFFFFQNNENNEKNFIFIIKNERQVEYQSKFDYPKHASRLDKNKQKKSRKVALEDPKYQKEPLLSNKQYLSPISTHTICILSSQPSLLLPFFSVEFSVFSFFLFY